MIRKRGEGEERGRESETYATNSLRYSANGVADCGSDEFGCACDAVVGGVGGDWHCGCDCDCDVGV